MTPAERAFQLGQRVREVLNTYEPRGDRVLVWVDDLELMLDLVVVAAREMPVASEMIARLTAERDAAVGRNIRLQEEAREHEAERIPVATFALEAMQRIEALAEKYEKRGKETGHAAFVEKSEAMDEAVEVVRGIPGWTGTEGRLPSAYILRDTHDAVVVAAEALLACDIPTHLTSPCRPAFEAAVRALTTAIARSKR